MNKAPTRLTLLDAQWPGHMADLVPAIERFRFYRYWATEHYSPTQSASPTVLTALAGGLSSTLRVGVAGVMLKAAPAARVAQDFALLNFFYPDRIDLGIVSALPGKEWITEYRPDVQLAGAEEYSDRLQRLRRLLPATCKGLQRHASIVAQPEMWLCGSGVSSAILAGRLGCRYAFHHYMSTMISRDSRFATEVTQAYREAFVPSEELQSPYVSVAAFGVCARSNARAAQQWREGINEIAPASFMGTGARCAESLRNIAEAYAADELAIDCLAPSLNERLDGLHAIADALSDEITAHETNR